MTPDISGLTFDQLRTLGREVAALIAQRRHEALERLRTEAATLGFTPNELIPGKKKGDSVAKYSDGNGNGWSGRGKRPRWLQEKLDAGHELTEFAI